MIEKVRHTQPHVVATWLRIDDARVFKFAVKRLVGKLGGPALDLIIQS